MMISKATFVSMITTIMTAIAETRKFCAAHSELTDVNKTELLDGCDYQKDLITMLEITMVDEYGVIRDFLYRRDKNGKLFFGIPVNGGVEVYLISSAEELYDYLALQMVDGVLRAVFSRHKK